MVIVDTFTFDVVLGKYMFVRTLFLFGGLTGLAYAIPQLNIKTDISYAVYIYHMTIVNALIELGYSQNGLLLLIVFVMTCLISWASTITVGEWSKKKKRIYLPKAD